MLAWPGFSVEAPTREKAIRCAQAAIESRLAQEDIVMVEVEPEERPNPWVEMAGIFADDPTWDEFQAEIEKYRRELNAEIQLEDELD